jgi:hypothetical protein
VDCVVTRRDTFLLWRCRRIAAKRGLPMISDRSGDNLPNPVPSGSDLWSVNGPTWGG